MPSDLNLKKSWNPKLLKNREKIWEKEHQIFEAYKKSQQQKAKLHEDKEKDDLLSLASGTKTSKPKTKTDWMYQSPVSSLQESSSAKDDEDMLLGKTRLREGLASDRTKIPTSKLDKVLKTGDETSERKTTVSQELSKSDPLFAIKLQQLRRKELLEKQRKIDKYRKRETERKGKHRHSSHSHHHHHHRHQDYKQSE